MIQFFKFSFLFALCALMNSGCSVETTDDDSGNSGISNQVAQGFTDANQAFITESAFAEQTTFFDDEGYLFHLFGETKTCDAVTSSFSGDIRFFVESTNTLEIKSYSGEGPYMGSTSFFGCEVEILELTDSTIVGKVKGGNFDGDKNIEGKFTAKICM